MFARPQHGNGVWAPSIRFHKGEFYIFYGDPDFGIYMVKARNAAGPWSRPRLIRRARGWIDPAPFWDDDGNAYLVHAWANSRSGIKSILTINRMSSDGTRLLDEGKMVFDGRVNHPTIEGPKLYKRNGYYYIFAPAGGVATGCHATKCYSFTRHGYLRLNSIPSTKNLWTAPNLLLQKLPSRRSSPNPCNFNRG